MFWTKKTPRNFISPTVRGALERTFSDFELDQLSRHGTLVDIDAGTKLAVEGTAGTQAVVIVTGTASVTRSGEQIATVAAGDIVGEMSLISGEPRIASVVADTAMTVYALSAPEFASLLAACPRLETKVTKTALRRLADAV